LEHLLSPDEVKRILEVEERDLKQLIRKGALRAYKVGGEYLRFREDEVLVLKERFQPRTPSRSNVKPPSPSWLLRLYDFWRFNNFYILSLILIAVLLYFVFSRKPPL